MNPLRFIKAIFTHRGFGCKAHSNQFFSSSRSGFVPEFDVFLLTDGVCVLTNDDFLLTNGVF
jgi:hypothetical protein